jgi:hypothetical protein
MDSVTFFLLTSFRFWYVLCDAPGNSILSALIRARTPIRWRKFTAAFEGENPLIPLAYNVRIIHEILREENGKTRERDSMKSCRFSAMQMKVVPLKCIGPQGTQPSYMVSPLEGILRHSRCDWVISDDNDDPQAIFGTLFLQCFQYRGARSSVVVKPLSWKVAGSWPHEVNECFLFT